MPIRVQLPDGSIGEFPDGMSDSAIEAVLQKQYGGPSESRPAGLPKGVDLPGVSAHSPVSMDIPQADFGTSVLGRLRDNAGGLLKPLAHPVKSLLSYSLKDSELNQGDVIHDILENPNKTGLANALGDTITAGALGAVSHAGPRLVEPIAEGMKRAGGGLIEETAGLHLKDIRHGAKPGRAYLEGGGTPAFSMEGLSRKAADVQSRAGTGLRNLYEASSNQGTKIPAADVYNQITEPINKLKTLKTSPGGTGITRDMEAFENSLIPPISQASTRGGFTPVELFDQMKKPISENTRWNDPTMYDLNKVRQQTVGRIGGMLTDVVPEAKPLNKIYQGSGNLAARAKMRAESGQSPLTAIGRRGIEAAIGAAIGSELHNPALAAIPLVLDTVPAKTTMGYSLFQGGKILPGIAGGLKPIAPFTPTANRRRTVKP